nr:glycosyltransferase family 4 protein [Arcanobacterium pluranimalium]
MIVLNKQCGVDSYQRASNVTELKALSDDLRVLHVLVNSSPHTASGYTVRTNAIMRGQRDSRIDAFGATRLAYPVTIGKLFSQSVDTVDGLVFHRLLPLTLPALLSQRLELHATMLADLVEETRPAIIHATTNYANGLVAQAVANHYGIPWVYEMRGQLEKTWVSRFPQSDQKRAAISQRYRLMHAQETALAKAASAVVVLSEVQRQDLIERGVSESKIFVVPNAYTPLAPRATADATEARRRLRIKEAFTIGTVTSVVDYEGLDTLIRAIKIARDSGADLRGVIVGDGVAKPSLCMLAEDLGVADAIDFVGRVSVDESHQWYESFDLFALPRKNTLVTAMVTPIKPIEAMANGTPVVASDLPPLRELVTDCGAGVTFAPDDAQAMAHAIRCLMDDAEAYATASEAAVRQAEQLTWDANIRRYRMIYQGLLGR